MVERDERRRGGGSASFRSALSPSSSSSPERPQERRGLGGVPEARGRGLKGVFLDLFMLSLLFGKKNESWNRERERGEFFFSFLLSLLLPAPSCETQAKQQKQQQRKTLTLSAASSALWLSGATLHPPSNLLMKLTADFLLPPPFPSFPSFPPAPPSPFLSPSRSVNLTVRALPSSSTSSLVRTFPPKMPSLHLPSWSTATRLVPRSSLLRRTFR